MNIVGEYRRSPAHAQRDALGRTICWFYQRGECRFGARCRFSHGEAISPTTQSPKQHNQIRNNVRPRNQRTQSSEIRVTTTESMSCGICLEKVKRKASRRKQVFGILPNCRHCFCFACLKKWRSIKEVATSASQSCPECRTPANYVYRSKIWYEDEIRKAAFIAKRNKNMRKTDCKSFRNGLGNCPRANRCMYRHATVDGYSVDLGSPFESTAEFDSDVDAQFERIYATYMNILARSNR